MFYRGKALVITGPRQVGKTTMITSLITEFKLEGQVRMLNCDNPADVDLLLRKNLTDLRKLIGSKKILYIDEAQKVPDIGNILKLLVDHYKKEIQIIVTGSSSLNLLYKTAETLTGRKLVYQLYSLSFSELFDDDAFEARKNLEAIMRYGTYPEIYLEADEGYKRRLLMEITDSYLFKDIFEFQNIRNPTVLRQLLKAIALQLGNEVSYNELSRMLGVDKNTVERYVDLLEKNYVIFRLPPFHSNKRNEITKMRKIYFYDVGIRNALIDDFKPLANRNDVGALWENLFIMERIKKNHYADREVQYWFWRTYGGAEVDLVEEAQQMLSGFEIKWNIRRKSKVPESWHSLNPASYDLVTKENMDEFLF